MVPYHSLSLLTISLCFHIPFLISCLDQRSNIMSILIFPGTLITKTVIDMYFKSQINCICIILTCRWRVVIKVSCIIKRFILVMTELSTHKCLTCIRSHHGIRWGLCIIMILNIYQGSYFCVIKTIGGIHHI